MARTCLALCVVIVTLSDAVRKLENDLERLTRSHAAIKQAATEEGHNAGKEDFFPSAISPRFFPMPPSFGSPVLRPSYSAHRISSMNPLLPLRGSSEDGISKSVENELQAFRLAQTDLLRSYLQPLLTLDTTMDDAVPESSTAVPMASPESITPTDEEENVPGTTQTYSKEKTFDERKEGVVPDEEEEPKDEQTSDSSFEVDEAETVSGKIPEDEAQLEHLKASEVEVLETKEASEVSGKASEEEAKRQYQFDLDQQIKIYEESLERALAFLGTISEASVQEQFRPELERHIQFSKEQLKGMENDLRTLRDIAAGKNAEEAQLQYQRFLDRQVQISEEALKRALGIVGVTPEEQPQLPSWTFEAGKDEEVSDTIPEEQTWLDNSFDLARTSQMFEEALRKEKEKERTSEERKQEDEKAFEVDKEKEVFLKTSAAATQKVNKYAGKEAQKDVLKRALQLAYFVANQQPGLTDGEKQRKAMPLSDARDEGRGD